jgi:REP element-mobilizing transposase RayT
MNKYQNKYRIPSARLNNWNYGAMGSYFITICTRNREHFFGKIVQKEMILNAIGKKVEEEWLKTIELRPDMNLELGNFVVMPNHFHGILIIGENEYNSKTGVDSGLGLQMDSRIDSRLDSRCRDAMHRVSTGTGTDHDFNSDHDAHHDMYTHHDMKNKFGPQSKNLGSIVRGFKSAVTTYSKTNALDCGSINFGWQGRFHDHIIRNAAEFERIQNYIATNVENWEKDKFYK